jgi:4-amino-4-deoxy-L-arabinose transferase-like glycosyltransferase
MAHSLLIGHPYQGTIPTRPLYIFLLTVLHLLFGENYRNIIIGQTLVLAMIPVVFYYLGKKMHSRIAGVTIALFFIFRELTALLVSSNTRVSNTKTLMVDLPTLLLLILACLFTLRWLEQKTEKNALIAGGMFGLLLLLRTQSMLVLPLILLVAILVLGWKSKTFYLLTSFFFLGLLATIIPWLTHNYLQTGQFAFDAPFQYKVIASQYAYTGNLDIDDFDFEGKGLGRVLIEFALKDPAFVFGFISNHFLATQIHGLLVLPLIKPYNGVFAPINLYWMEWNGTLEWYNLLLVIFYLAVIALGLGSAWKRWRWAGLLPLAFSAGYALATAVGRFSGWRYDLPADWAWYFYFGIGAELLPGCLARTRLSSLSRQIQAKHLFLINFYRLICIASALPWLLNIASSL